MLNILFNNDWYYKMKIKLENIWVVVQVFAVFVGGYWTYDTWVKYHRSELLPHFKAGTTPISGRWGNANKDVCEISTHWNLSNQGKAPINVKEITIDVWSIKDNYKFNFEGKVKDLSLSALDLEKEGTINMKDSIDRIQAKGSISRDIKFALNPQGNNEKWFAEHRVMLEIIAKVDSDTVSNSDDVSIAKTALGYVCYTPSDA